MSKLTKMEISAIASKIAETCRESIKQENELLSSDESFNRWLTQFKLTAYYQAYLDLNQAKQAYNILYKDVRAKNRWGGIYLIAETLISEEFLRNQFLYFINQKSETVSEEVIVRDIIIAQAKNADLDSLVEELTNKYSN